MPKVRRSFTIAYKLEILAQSKTTQLSQRKFALSKGISGSTLRTWQKDEEKIRSCPVKRIRKLRYVPRIRKGQFPAVESELIEWIKDRNVRGVRVKDKFIQAQCKTIRDRILAELEDGAQKESLQLFKVSRIWLHRFKSRFNLKSRRHTTTHTLPERFRELAIDFIELVHKKCEEFNITRERIINMDQVPRYFENDKNTTITTRGTAEVLLRKSSTSHKRFTFTPFVTAQGKMLKKHALFSNLKNIPRHDPRCTVDVNHTGMWNERILSKELTDAAKIARGLFSLRSNVLIILDSYGVHTKFISEKEEHFKSMNIHFAIIPARLTGLLQPLDVCLNRSFQQYFNDCTDAYQADSLREDNNKTKLGNVKMPSSEMVTRWTAEWCDSKSPEEIAKAFDVCGLVPRAEFDIENLHQPLRAAFKQLISTDEWLRQYASLVSENRVAFREECSQHLGKHAFLRAVYKSCEEDVDDEWEDWLRDMQKKIDNLLKNDPLTAPLYSETDKAVILDGTELSYGLLEAYAASLILKFPIHMIPLDSNDIPKNRTVFGDNEVGEIRGFYTKARPLKVFWDPLYEFNDLEF